MNTVYLSLGSNLGDRESHLKEAISLLSGHNFIDVEAFASFIETVPQGRVTQQPMFLNSALKVTTILTPLELLSFTQEIELEMGRETKGDMGPRVIDIDIIFYGTDIVSEDDLVVPHPMAHEREFVLRPLAELCPGFLHPILGVSVQELLDDCC